jgi:hypothetical protein
MKFFTRGWVDGDMTDEEADAVVRSYWRQIEALNLPPSVRDLADLNPHDAYILDVEHEPRSQTLRLRLRCGDLEIGYFDAVLDFSDVRIEAAHLALLVESRRPEAEVLYDEVDRVDGRVFEYRLLLHPEGEVAMRFGDVAVTRLPVAER